MADYKSPLVIAIHGVRTHADWHKKFAQILNDRGNRFRLYDYGFYRLHRFLFSRSRQHQVNLFHEEFNRIILEHKDILDLNDPLRRPSVVAHSFGTFILGECLRKYRHVRFDKILLVGSILPCDFDWADIFAHEQANFVRNERGLYDWVVPLAPWVAKLTGPSGNDGFTFVGSGFEQDHFPKYGHSDFFWHGHITDKWLPFFSKMPAKYTTQHGRHIADRPHFIKLLNQAHEIDLNCFIGLAGFEKVDLKRGLSTGWIEIEPDIYTFVLEDGAVRGYINAMPVTDDLFTRIKEGKVNDPDITPDDIAPFTRGRRLKIYLMSIAIDPQTKGANLGLSHEVSDRLLRAFIGKLIWYAIERDIRVTELSAVGWTAKGRKMCELMGMTKTGRNDPSGYPIYSIELSAQKTPAAASLGIRELLKVYAKLDAAGNQSSDCK
jgi:hypothetical protein